MKNQKEINQFYKNYINKNINTFNNGYTTFLNKNDHDDLYHFFNLDRYYLLNFFNTRFICIYTNNCAWIFTAIDGTCVKTGSMKLEVRFERHNHLSTNSHYRTMEYRWQLDRDVHCIENDEIYNYFIDTIMPDLESF